jgi:hypothetical protein
MVEGTKLTGDPNVPFKKVTFKADLSQALLYTNVEDQVGLQFGNVKYESKLVSLNKWVA